MSVLTTNYIVIVKNTNYVWEFKYSLNGILKEFKIVEGELTPRTQESLFKQGKFPYKEEQIKKWTSKYFKITINKPIADFELFWKMYDHKIKRVVSEKSWSRLSAAQRLKATDYIKTYKGYLSRKGVAQAAASTYLNQHYWEDNHGSIH